jgi:hypothetical protein
MFELKITVGFGISPIISYVGSIFSISRPWVIGIKRCFENIKNTIHAAIKCITQDLNADAHCLCAVRDLRHPERPK